jgi:membrane protease YdiL (CAAX protease family)
MVTLGLTGLNALVLALGATAAYVLLVRIGDRVTAWLTPVVEQPSARGRASRHLLGSALGQALTVILIATLLLRAGLSLRDLGLARPATWQAWGAALALGLLGAGALIAGPLRRSATLREWSAYRASGALLAAVGAGFGEEIVFRGFVISALAWGDWGAALQIAGSALLFGLARAGWGAGAGTGSFQVKAVTAATATGFGLLYAVLYVEAGRSLLPVILAHGLAEAAVQPALFEVVLTRRQR